jgi:hypothetical protein
MDIAEVILAGLEAPMTSEERDAWRTPPYRLPPSLVPLQRRLLTELDAHLPGDGDAGAAHQDVTTRVRSSPIELRSLARRLWRAESFDVADTACALLAAGVLHASAAERIAGRLPPYSGFRRHLVRNSLATGDLVSAGEHTAAIGPNAWVGYREVYAFVVEAEEVAEGTFGQVQRVERQWIGFLVVLGRQRVLTGPVGCLERQRCAAVLDDAGVRDRLSDRETCPSPVQIAYANQSTTLCMACKCSVRPCASARNRSSSSEGRSSATSPAQPRSDPNSTRRTTARQADRHRRRACHPRSRSASGPDTAGQREHGWPPLTGRSATLPAR